MTFVELDKGLKGSKRASWSKANYRDLALRVCEVHPDLEVEELAREFLKELEQFPEYMSSIAIYIMANVKASLDQKPRARPTTPTATVERIAARVLMRLQMPSGKLLGESTGAECVKTGGWLREVGKAVGPRGIVSEKLTEDDLARMLRASGKVAALAG
jgi:hypothetical protein